MYTTILIGQKTNINKNSNISLIISSNNDEIFNNEEILKINTPIIIAQDDSCLNYDFLPIISQLNDNNIKLLALPNPINSSINDKLIDLVYNSILSNDDAIFIYEQLKLYNYDINFKGIFLDNYIGFANIDEYKKFSNYALIYKNIKNLSILYTYIINKFYIMQEVIPMSIKTVRPEYYFNNAIFYNNIEKLIY